MLVLAMERSRDGPTGPLGGGSDVASVSHSRWTRSARSKISGDHGGGATPVPIPNTAVKPASADGTWGASPWESRTSPDFFTEGPVASATGPSSLYGVGRSSLAVVNVAGERVLRHGGHR